MRRAGSTLKTIKLCRHQSKRAVQGADPTRTRWPAYSHLSDGTLTEVGAVFT